MGPRPELWVILYLLWGLFCPVLALDEPIQTVLIVGGSVCGGVIIIVLIIVTFKLCKMPKDKQKRGSMNRGRSNRYANGGPVYAGSRHGRPRPPPPLPAGVWTSNPTMYAGGPADPYNGMANPMGQPNGIPHPPMERIYAPDPMLRGREPFLRRTVRRAQTMLKNLPAVFQVKRAAKAPMPSIPESKDRRQADVQSELVMSEETATEAQEEPAPPLTVTEKENTTAKVFSDYTLQTYELERTNTTKAFSNYTDPVHILATDETGENVAFATSNSHTTLNHWQQNVRNFVPTYSSYSDLGPREPMKPVTRTQSYLDPQARQGKYVNRASSFQSIDKLKKDKNNMHLYQPAVLRKESVPVSNNYVMKTQTIEPAPPPMQYDAGAPQFSRPFSSNISNISPAPVVRPQSDAGEPSINHFPGPKDPFAIYARPSKIKRETRQYNNPRQQVSDSPASPPPPPVPPPAPHSPITEELPRGGAVVNGIPQSYDGYDGNQMTTAAVVENDDSSHQSYDYPELTEEVDTFPTEFQQKFPGGYRESPRDSKSVSSYDTGSMSYSRTKKKKVPTATLR